MVAASGRTQRERAGRAVGFGRVEGSAGSGPRHVSQVLPDVLARYGITAESVERSGVTERRGRILELATVEGNPAACAAGCW